MFKPFFVHINPHSPGKMNSKHPRGATIYVSPTDAPSLCCIQVALCSPKDEFNKSVGRAVAMAAEVEVIRKRDLPQWVAKVDHLCGKKYFRRDVHYMHLLRNFL